MAPRNSAGSPQTHKTEDRAKEGTRAAADAESSTPRRTMPCAEDELCLQQDRTPGAPHGHVCRGGCGGRLHGNCESVFDDNDQNRICSTCVTRTGKRKTTAAEGAGTGPSKRPTAQGRSKRKKGSRARQRRRAATKTRRSTYRKRR